MVVTFKNPPTQNIKFKTKASIGDKIFTMSKIVLKNTRLLSPPLIVSLDGSHVPLPAFLSNEPCSVTSQFSSALFISRGHEARTTTKLSKFEKNDDEEDDDGIFER